MRVVGAVLTAVAALAAGCPAPGEERALAELSIGRELTAEGVELTVRGGLARVERAERGELVLWAQAPAFELDLLVPATAAGRLRLEVRNSPGGTEAAFDDGPAVAAIAREHTTSVFELELTAGAHVLAVAPADAQADQPFRFLALADIQTALPTVHQVFAEMNRVPDARFVVFMGDLTERSELAEYELALRQLETLDLPFYATLGNHELWADAGRFHRRFGRASFQFVFRQVAFTFADSGDAGLDPLVESWIDEWLEAARDRTHVFLSHFPPVDPEGLRDGSYRSRRDGQRLLAKLAREDVDLTLFGHIHTFHAYTNAGIPSYVSGGGGARQERWDGIERHFLVIDLGAAGIDSVAVRRVD